MAKIRVKNDIAWYTIEEGEFENGKLNGKGQVTYPDGKVKQGTFQKGILQT